MLKKLDTKMCNDDFCAWLIFNFILFIEGINTGFICKLIHPLMRFYYTLEWSKQDFYRACLSIHSQTQVLSFYYIAFNLLILIFVTILGTLLILVKILS